jgi:diacylglycerol kinase (ATP)
VKPSAHGIADLRRVIRALGFSLQGLKAAWGETAFRQEIVLFVILAPLGYWLGRDPVERVLLIGCLVLVLIVELLNSAIEATVDRVGKDRHKLAGHAKDMGSAAVLLAILLAVLVWGMVLVPRVF